MMIRSNLMTDVQLAINLGMITYFCIAVSSLLDYLSMFFLFIFKISYLYSKKTVNIDIKWNNS